MLTEKTTRLKTARRDHPRRISHKRLPHTRVLVAWDVAISGASVLCSGIWCRPISLLLCGIPCRPSHGSHLLSFCSALLYHIHTARAGLLFRASRLDFCTAIRAHERAERSPAGC